MAGGYLPWGTPHPVLARGYLPWLGVPNLGYPHPVLAGGYLPWGTPSILTWLGVTYLGQGVPTLGYPLHPDLAGGYLPWPGGTYLGVPPHLDLAGGYLPCITPPPSGPGQGTPCLVLARVPPPRCRQTENITFLPSFGCGR